jgi:23S rRNA (uracil1939-C5)-methyltransferase
VPRPGDQLALQIVKPAAGGRMLARHDGQVVLVAGTIPGERVQARVERVAGGVLFARTVSIDAASPDRRRDGPEASCGGNDFGHIGYARQLALKQEIVADAFARIAKRPLDLPVQVHESREDGYRMRARLHVQGRRVGFYREGTHDLCDARSSRQLLPQTTDVLEALAGALASGGIDTALTVDLAENVSADERAVLVDLDAGRREHGRWDGLLDLVDATGVAVSRGGRLLGARGESLVHDVVSVPVAGRPAVRLSRDVRAFFQGNRHLLQTLVDRVLSHIPAGPLVDLYAGCGLFGVAHAAAGRGPVEAVESDPIGAGDLRDNAAAAGDGVLVHATTVEAYLESAGPLDGKAVLVDPPRTGLSRAVCARLAASAATRLVYLSCDVATLARDARRLLDGGYTIRAVEVLDLFPSTSHVETLIVAERVSLD